MPPATTKSKKREQIEKEQKVRADERERLAKLKVEKENEKKEQERMQLQKEEEERIEKEKVRVKRNAKTLEEANAMLDPLVRPRLLFLLRKATLCHDELSQEIIMNHLLRNYIHHNMYREADLLVSNTKDTLSQPFRSNNQMARYFYNLGRIKMVQLLYTEANDLLQQALRKAPEQAIGFKTVVTKMSILVQLLLGEIPPRSTFRQAPLQKALYPYLQLTSSVRFGELPMFNKVVEEFGEVFKKDSTFTLVQRIHQNVIKTGLRRIIHAYAKISIGDICQKLQLDYPEDAEYIIAKAIRDGVIDATIDHEAGVVTSTEIADVYSTPEPCQAFTRRIQHLTDTHNQALMAMRYMPADIDQDSKDDIEREQRLEEEKALQKSYEEEEDDDMEM